MMIRLVSAALGGIVVAVIVVGIVEMIGHTIFPPPADLDLSDPAQAAKLIERLPVASLLFVLIAWAAGSFTGGCVATVIARRASIVPALAVAVAMLLGTLYSLYVIPHPLWMAAAGLLIPFPAAWLGARLAQSRGRPAAS